MRGVIVAKVACSKLATDLKVAGGTHKLPLFRRYVAIRPFLRSDFSGLTA